MGKSINSALNQTHYDIEIIVVDDGSTDKSFEVAKTFESERVKIVKQVNSGAAIARNTGLSFATGDYIQFLDAGDLITIDKIEKQVLQLERNPNMLAVCNYIQIDNYENIPSFSTIDQSSFIHSSDNPVNFLINLLGGNGQSNFIQTNCWLVPRNLILKAGLWREFRCPDDDGEFFSRMILASEGIVHVEGVYNYYYMSTQSNQLSTNMNSKYVMNKLLSIQLKHHYLIAAGGHPNLNKAIAMQYFYFSISHFPQSKKIVAIAYKRYKEFNIKIKLPIIGGRFIMLLSKVFGWKISRFLRYHLREK